MEHRLLHSSTEVSAFAAHFAARCPNPVEPEYFERADRIRAFFQAERMVGGYVVNAARPLRYDTLIPASAAVAPPLRDALRDGRSCEITCMWLDRLRMSSHERNAIYLWAALDALALRRRWIVGGSTNPKVARTQKRIMPEVVYTGPWDFPGCPHQAQIFRGRWGQLLALIALAYTTQSLRDALRRGTATLRGRAGHRL